MRTSTEIAEDLHKFLVKDETHTEEELRSILLEHLPKDEVDRVIVFSGLSRYMDLMPSKGLVSILVRLELVLIEEKVGKARQEMGVPEKRELSKRLERTAREAAVAFRYPRYDTDAQTFSFEELERCRAEERLRREIHKSFEEVADALATFQRPVRDAVFVLPLSSGLSTEDAARIKHYFDVPRLVLAKFKEDHKTAF